MLQTWLVFTAFWLVWISSVFFRQMAECFPTVFCFIWIVPILFQLALDCFNQFWLGPTWFLVILLLLNLNPLDGRAHMKGACALTGRVFFFYSCLANQAGDEDTAATLWPMVLCRHWWVSGRGAVAALAADADAFCLMYMLMTRILLWIYFETHQITILLNRI